MLTPQDLEELEGMLVQIGEEQGSMLLDGMLQRTESPSLVYFVRRTVGLDRRAVQALFAEYLQAKNLTSAQIRFIETLIDQLTAQGVVDSAALYELPVSDMCGKLVGRGRRFHRFKELKIGRSRRI